MGKYPLIFIKNGLRISHCHAVGGTNRMVMQIDRRMCRSICITDCLLGLVSGGRAWFACEGVGGQFGEDDFHGFF